MWKQAAKNSIIILGGVLISRLFVFLYRIFVIRTLSVEDYAVFVLLTTIFQWVFVFSHIDLYSGVSKYVSETIVTQRISEARLYYHNAIIIVMGFSTSGLFAGFFLSYSSGINSWVLAIFFISLIPFSICNINCGFIRGCKKFTWSALVDSSTGISRFLIFILFLLILKNVTINHILLLFSSALAIPSFVSALMVVKLKVFEHKEKNVISKAKMMNLFHYSKWVSLTDLLNSGKDLIIVCSLSKLSHVDLAQFNIIMLVYSFFQMGFGAITTVLIPQVAQKAAQGNAIRLLGKREFWGLAIIIFFIILGIFAIPNKEMIILYVLGKETYSDTLFYVGVLLVVFPFRVLTMTYKGVAQGLNYTKPIAFVSFMVFVTNIIFFILLYNWRGLSGAVASMIIAFLVEFFLTRSVAAESIAKYNTSSTVKNSSIQY